MVAKTARGTELAQMLDAPIPYLERVRTYYHALGYGAPYEWAQFASVPFAPLRKPLARCRIAIVTTAAPYQPGKGDQGPGAPYNAQAKFYAVYSAGTASDPDLRISHIAIDRAHTKAADQGTYFALRALRRAASAGRIDEVAPRFHGLPTNRRKDDYCNIERLSADEIAQRRAEFDRQEDVARGKREEAGR